MTDDEMLFQELVEPTATVESEGPIIDRIPSVHFDWAQSAFAHASKYVDQLTHSDNSGADDAARSFDEDACQHATTTTNASSVEPVGFSFGEQDGFDSDAVSSADDAIPFHDSYDEASSFHDSYDVDECIPEQVIGRRRRKGVTEWLVTWKYILAPRWENEQELVDAGHQRFIDAYIKEKDALRQRATEEARHIANANKKTAKKSAKSEKDANINATPARLCVFDPVKFWPGFESHVVYAFNLAGLKVTSITHCLKHSRAKTFVSLWTDLCRTSSGHVAPTMLFHGTSDVNWASIAARGFFVPGQGGVRVVNGSAYGLGVYTATTPSISTGYVRGARAIFVCAGLITDHFASTVKNCGSTVVFTEREQVVPCALVHYEPCYANRNQPEASWTVTQKSDLTEFKPQASVAATVKPQRVFHAAKGYSLAAKFTTTPSEAFERHMLKTTGGRLSKKELKQLPSAAKALWKQGMFKTLKSDRSKNNKTSSAKSTR
jgi:hypothetical protein